MKRQLMSGLIPFLVLALLKISPTWAQILPENHLLYPRSAQAIYLTGIEVLATPNQVKRAIEHCEKPVLLCELISSFKNSSNLSAVEEYFSNTTAQLVFLGERHINQEIQFSLANLLPIFKKNQFEAIALEMFNHEDQFYLDQFNQGELSIEELEVILKKNWNYSSAGYLAIFQTARELNLKLLALDDRQNTTHLNFSDNLIERDRIMARTLQKNLKSNPNKKIIVYTGRLHGFQSFDTQEALTISEILKKDRPDLKTESYLFFSYREKSVIPEMRKALSPYRNLVFKSSELSPYFDGAILLGEPQI